MDKHCGRLDIISGKSERIDFSDAVVTFTLTVVEAVYGCVNDAYQLR